MLNKHIARAIAGTAIFLEFSPEELLDPDAAIAAMEQLSAELQLTPDNVKAELVSAFQAVSSEYGEKSAFVAGLADSLGLT